MDSSLIIYILIYLALAPRRTAQQTDSAAFSTTPSPALHEACVEQVCTEGERCGERNGKFGCVCTNVPDSGRSETFDYDLRCNGPDSAVSLPRCMLFEAGFSVSVLHLNDPNCVGNISEGRVVFSFVSNRITCGNKLKVNQTHFIYSNTIRGAAEAEFGAIVTRKHNFTLGFSCVYPLTINLSSTVVISAVQSVINITLPLGEGSFETKMLVYRDPGYSQPFTQTPVLLGVNDKIYIGSTVSGIDASQFMLTLSNCWATPDGDPATPTRWSIIVNRCPSVVDGTVNIEENGLSTIARFSFNVFRFVGDASEVYLHCQMLLCDAQATICFTQCPRGRADAGGIQTNESVHTTGPYRKKFQNEGESNSGKPGQTAHWVAMATLNFAAIIGCLR